MKLNPRYRPCTRARRDIEDAVWKAMRGHELTYHEVIQAITECLITVNGEALRVQRGDSEDD